jgi:hypothetical protein
MAAATTTEEECIILACGAFTKSGGTIYGEVDKIPEERIKEDEINSGEYSLFCVVHVSNSDQNTIGRTQVGAGHTVFYKLDHPKISISAVLPSRYFRETVACRGTFQ